MTDMNDGYAMCYNEWALDTDIKNELGLLCIISSLCAERGYCYAGNEYFSKLFQVEEETVSRKIKKLTDKGYINVVYRKRGCEIIGREIRLIKKSTDDCQKNQPTIDKKVKENNTSINNTSINNYIVPDGIKEEFEAYKQMRRMMKKPMTDYAVRMALKKLNKMSPDINVQKEILNQSVEHSWLGLFPVKDFKQDTLPVYDTSKNKEYSEEYINELLRLRGTNE